MASTSSNGSVRAATPSWNEGRAAASQHDSEARSGNHRPLSARWRSEHLHQRYQRALAGLGSAHTYGSGCRGAS